MSKEYELADKLREAGFRKVHKKGDEVWACCPNPDHYDNNPSWSANPDKGVHSCFSCGFKGSLKRLLDNYSLDFDLEEQNVETLPDLFSFLEPSPSRIASKNPGVLDHYLKDPSHFRASWGVSEEVSERRGLCIDPFTGAECFPIFDRQKNFWGLVERHEDKLPKYLYPKDFDKSQHLLGEDQVEKEIFLVEGIRDLCAIETKYPGERAVALGGALPSRKQLELLRRFDKIFVALDNDFAGEKGVVRLWKNLPKEKLYRLKFDGKDPQDSMKFKILKPKVI